MANNAFTFRQRLLSFKYAYDGLRVLFKEEHNSWIHFWASVIAIGLGIFLHISTIEWCMIVICIGMVFSMELINSALENLSDHVSPEKNELIKKAKDLGAAGVLMSAIAALAIGIVIFLPKTIALLNQ